MAAAANNARNPPNNPSQLTGLQGPNLQQTAQGVGASMQYNADATAARVNQTSGSGLPPLPPLNRFQQQQRELARTSAFGTSMDEVMKAATEGHTDFNKHVRETIKMEYFTFRQYIRGILNGIVIGMFIAVMVFWQGDVVTLNIGSKRDMFLGIVFAAAFLYGLFAYWGTKRAKRCHAGRRTDPSFVGRSCLSARDCTLGDKIVPFACRPGDPPFLFKIMRFPGLLAAIALSIYFIVQAYSGDGTGSYNFNDPREFGLAYVALVLGMFGGYIYMYFFS